jgi:hypothetical protein
MLDWTAIENALVVWVEHTLGEGQVIWADQEGPQPGMPYATLKITGRRSMTPTPELHHYTDLGNPAGEEVEQTVIDHQEITVSCQVFALNTTGAKTARDLLGRVRMSIFLPARLTALREAGLALVEAGDTQDLTALLETTWQSRAALDVRFNTVDTATEKTGYIETVSATGSYT